MKKKKEAQTKQTPQYVLALIIFMMIFIGELFVYTWSHVQCVQAGYAITEGKEESRRLKVLQDKLKIELAHLKSPGRISDIAEKKLGLILPRADQTIVLE